MFKMRTILNIIFCLNLFCFTFSNANIKNSITDSSLSEIPPPLERVYEIALLSEAVYSLHDCNDLVNKLSPDIARDVTCHMYEQAKSKTQVMVVSSTKKKYIAVVFAGTDSIKDWMHDADIAMTSFGPLNHPFHALIDNKNTTVNVHKGFNHAVFSDGLYDRIYSTVSKLLKKHPRYQLLTSGHSLGGADSILTAAAFSFNITDKHIQSLSFGCPRTGDHGWKTFVDRIPNLGIWRFVYKDDMIPRLPGIRFQHVGHTVQLTSDETSTYYLHVGDKQLHYAGVPRGWSCKLSFSRMTESIQKLSNSFLLMHDIIFLFLSKITILIAISFIDPFALPHHAMKYYTKFIDSKSKKNPNLFWIHGFVPTKEEESKKPWTDTKEFLTGFMDQTVM